MSERVQFAGFSELIRAYLEGLNDRYKVLPVPTNASWTEATTGSGTTNMEPFNCNTKTGTTASSTSQLRVPTFAVNDGATLGAFTVDWDKRLELHFALCRNQSDAEVVAYFQLKEVNTIGDLAAKGLGIKIENLTLKGEGYGTSRGEVTLGTLVNHRVHWMSIVHEPARQISYYLNGAIVGTLAGAYAPTGGGGAGGFLMNSIQNGVTGGVDAIMRTGLITLVQAW